MSNNETQAIDEDVFKSFIWSVWNFFTVITGSEPTVGTPYLFNSFIHDDYTGAIGISGSHRGSIYFTVSKELLDKILAKHYANHVNDDLSADEREEYRKDYAGEMINMIGGNVRNYLGHEFLISVPIVITSPGLTIELPEKGAGIIFPITWENMRSHLVLNFQADPKLTDKVIKSLNV